jgi:hypothetical protein
MNFTDFFKSFEIKKSHIKELQENLDTEYVNLYLP